MKLFRLFDGETHIYVGRNREEVLQLHGKDLGEDPSIYAYLDDQMIQLDDEDKGGPVRKKAKDWVAEYGQCLLASTQFYGKGWLPK